jgi:hypothetical protein
MTADYGHWDRASLSNQVSHPAAVRERGKAGKYRWGRAPLLCAQVSRLEAVPGPVKADERRQRRLPRLYGVVSRLAAVPEPVEADKGRQCHAPRPLAPVSRAVKAHARTKMVRRAVAMPGRVATPALGGEPA